MAEERHTWVELPVDCNDADDIGVTARAFVSEIANGSTAYTRTQIGNIVRKALLTEPCGDSDKEEEELASNRETFALLDFEERERATLLKSDRIALGLEPPY